MHDFSDLSYEVLTDMIIAIGTLEQHGIEQDEEIAEAIRKAHAEKEIE